MDYIFSLFSDWSLNSILYGVAGLVLLLTVFETTTVFFFKKQEKRSPDLKRWKPLKGYFKILRVFLRFVVIFIFLKIIEKPGGLLYPWNILYESSALLFLIAGVLFSVHKFLNLLVKYSNLDSIDTLFKRNLLVLTNKGLKITLYFVIFSLFLWNIIEQVPEELKKTEIVQIGVLINGIIISVIILMVVQKTRKSTLELLQGKKDSLRLSIIIKSLSFPLQLITISAILFWYKNMNIPINEKVIDKFIYLLLLAAFIIFIYRVVESLGTRLSSYSNSEKNPLDKTFIEIIRMIIRISIILIGIFGTVQILTGKPLTALMAGLGIGGLAVALAAQDTIKNFFGSIMIMTDKPFKIGERIVVKDYDGVIEAIGFRSTRIRTLVGHQVIIPNDQIATNSIENIGRRPHIRRLTNITVTYGTTAEKMERALEIIRDILTDHEGMNEDFPPRVFFNEFNADSLNIIMLYWYSPPDYWKFMEFSQSVNLQIMKEFKIEGIEFAFPTSTTYLEQADGQSLKMEFDSPFNK